VSNGGPDRINILLRDAVASQKATGDIRAVNSEALIHAAVLMVQAHVVKRDRNLSRER
jgi:hypothetical protein